MSKVDTIGSSRMKKNLIALSAILAFLAPTISGATTTLQTAPCINDLSALCAITINGLVIGTTTLNVNFAAGSYDSVYGDTDPFFPNNQASAQAAAESIALLFTANEIEGVIGNGTGPDLPDVVRIPVHLYFDNSELWSHGLFLYQTAALAPSSWNHDGEYFGITSIDSPVPGEYRHWARFTVVPVPAAVWLFASALVLLFQSGNAGQQRSNKALQRTLDPSTFFAAAKNAAASSTAELRR